MYTEMSNQCVKYIFYTLMQKNKMFIPTVVYKVIIQHKFNNREDGNY